MLLDERTNYSELNRDDLIFAQQWDRRLVVAGGAGIYAYDIDLHHWERLFDQSVTVALAMPDDAGFYFAHPGGAGRITADGQIQRWELAGDQIIRLLFGRDTNEVLALSGNGNLLALGANKAPDTIFRTGSTAFDPASFTLAADLGEQVFLLGPAGVLLHDLATRSYRDIPATSLPDWMQRQDLRAYRAGDHVYFLAGASANLEIYPVSTADLANPTVYTDTMQVIAPLTLPGPAQRLWDWPGAGLGLIDAEGSVYAVSPTGITRRTGEPRAGLDRETLLDVATQKDNLVVATNAGVRYYDAAARGWVAGADPGQRIEELGVLGDRLLGRSDRNELLQIVDPPQPLIGEREGTQIGDGDLNDARLVGSELYLAGAGRVERYQTDQRRITQRWQFGTTGPVRIRGLINGEPLVQSGEAAYLGDAPIDPAAGPIVALAADSTTIWTTRRAEAQPYLKGYPIGGPLSGSGARCFFRNPWTPAPATRVEDARRLPDGTLAVATDAGLMFYAPQARSWLCRRWPSWGGWRAALSAWRSFGGGRAARRCLQRHADPARLDHAARLLLDRQRGAGRIANRGAGRRLR